MANPEPTRRRPTVGLLSRSIAAQLRITRAARGWTQQDLADAVAAAAAELGEPEQAVSRAVIVTIEQERRPVRIDEIPPICLALGMTTPQLTDPGRSIDSATYLKVLAVTAPDRLGPQVEQIEATRSGDLAAVVREAVRGAVAEALDANTIPPASPQQA